MMDKKGSAFCISIIAATTTILAASCSAPEPVSDINQASLNQVLDELQAVKNQLASIESRLLMLEVEAGDENEHAGPDASIDELSMEKEFEWLSDYTKQFEDQDFFSDTDPQVAIIAERFENKIEQLIEFNERAPWQPYVIDAIRALLTPENEFLVLERMDTQDDFVDIAHERGMHQTHPSYFYSALESRINQRSEYIPTGLIEFAAETELDRFKEDLEDYAVHGTNIHLTFEALAAAGYQDLPDLSERSFARLGLGDSWEDIHRAYVAAKHAGNATALSEFLSICLNLPEDEREFSNCDTGALIRHSGSIEDISAIQKQLEYKNLGRYWHLPS